MIPAVLLSRPAMYVGVAVAVLGTLWLWDRSRIARERREAVAAQVVAAAMEEKKIAEAQRDSLMEALAAQQIRTDTAVAAVRAVSVSYGTERRRVNLAAPQLAGTPPDMVLVPRSFVAMADSLLVAMREMIAAQAQEREATNKLLASAARTDSIKDTIIEAQAVELKAKGGGLVGKVVWAAVGGGIAAVAVAVFIRR